MTTSYLDTYSPASLDNIEKSNFLSNTDFDFIKSASQELQDTFEKKQLWRTDTEIRVSVLNDISFPTVASKYWQAVREQSVFFDNLVQLSFEYRKNEVKIKQIERELYVLTDDLELELKQIELEEAKFGRANMELQAKDRVREIRIWSSIKQDLVKQDPTFDTQNVNSHQAISYGQQFLLELQVLQKTGNPSFGEVQSALSKLQSTLKYGLDHGCLNEMLSVVDAGQKGQALTILSQAYPDSIPELELIADGLGLVKQLQPQQ